MPLFCLAVLALIASPGPDFFYVLGRGVAQGPRAGVLSALGIALGLCVHTALAVLGLSALLAASEWLFLAVKLAGAAYLGWMGWKMLRARDSHASEGVPVAGRSIVRQAMLTNVLNPKAALTFVAFLPQWVDPSRPVAAQLALLGGATVGLALVWFSLVGIGAARLGQVLGRRPSWQRSVNRATGALLIGLAVALALQEK